MFINILNYLSLSGFEPLTSPSSRKHSTTELQALISNLLLLVLINILKK